MTTPNTLLQQQGAAAQQLIDQASALWVTAADQSDTVEGLGIDARINLVHSLVDLWAKGSVALIQAYLKGPSQWPGPPSPSYAAEPLPSEPITVAPQPYPRQLAAAGPFVRVGVPLVTIDPSCLTFKPAILAAHGTQFEIALTDYRYVGANYSGKVLLTSAPETAGPAPDEKVLTVGL